MTWACKTDELSKLLRRAESGHADAQFELGKKYAEGEGVEKDIKEAAK